MMYDDDHLEAEFQAHICIAYWSGGVAIICALVALSYALVTT